MKLNSAGETLIKKRETLRLVAYPDPESPRAVHFRQTKSDDKSLSGAPWTIGWGHTKGVHEGDSISPGLAEMYFQEDVSLSEETVEQNVHVPLNTNQFSALVSLVFNIGATNFLTSTLLKCLNRADYEGASREFLVWDRSGGRYVQGLENRRLEEQALFNAPVVPFEVGTTA